MSAPDKICVAPHQIFDYDLDIQEVGHNGAEEYIRKDVVKHIIRGARGPQDALNKIESL